MWVEDVSFECRREVASKKAAVGNPRAAVT